MRTRKKNSIDVAHINAHNETGRLPPDIHSTSFAVIGGIVAPNDEYKSTDSAVFMSFPIVECYCIMLVQRLHSLLEMILSLFCPVS